MRRTLPALVGLTLLLVAGACGGAGESGNAAAPTTRPAASGPVESNGTVRRVVDGDTLVVDLDGEEERVRLIGVDTPESVKPNSPVECFGKEASKHTAELVPPGTRVRVELDVEPRDRYRRLLGYVYRADDGLFVNLALARDGFANQLTIPPNVAHEPEFRAAVREARAAGAGLWSACRDNDPFAR
ncbi:MAG: thermonuclease family protein [Microthrixaceae bacterium]